MKMGKYCKIRGTKKARKFQMWNVKIPDKVLNQHFNITVILGGEGFIKW